MSAADPTPDTIPGPDSTVSAPGGAQGRKFAGRVKDALLGYAFLAPALIVFAVFAYYPLYRLFWYATHQQSRFRNRPAQWVGTEQIVDTLNASTATFKVTQIRVLGGAIADVAADATAYAHRTAPIMVNIAAFFTTPSDKEMQTRWVDEYAAAMQQEITGAYVNFVGDEGAERIHAAYPTATWSGCGRSRQRSIRGICSAGIRTSFRRNRRNASRSYCRRA